MDCRGSWLQVVYFQYRKRGELLRHVYFVWNEVVRVDGGLDRILGVGRRQVGVVRAGILDVSENDMEVIFNGYAKSCRCG